jgi:hypothetical protein
MSIVIGRTTNEDFEPYFRCALCGERFVAHDVEVAFEPFDVGVDERPGTIICLGCRKGGVSKLAARGRLTVWAMGDVIRRLCRPSTESLLAQIQARLR